MLKRVLFLFLILCLLTILIGCGGGNPIIPPGDETTTDEEFNDIINTGKEAVDKFEEYCNSIGEEQAYQATVDFLEQQDGVKEAGIGEDGTTIWFEYENGYLVGILSTEEDEKANEKEIELSFDQSKVVPSTEKALILNPGFNPVGTLKAQKIKGKLNSLYGDYDYESGSDVSVELMKELYQYSVIYIITHGGIMKGNENFCLNIEATTDIKDQYDDYFKNQYLVAMWVENPITKKSKPYVSITPSFIKQCNSGTFPDSLICIDACHSLENKTMAKAFEEKGAYAYCGYTTTMKFGYDEPVDFFGNLISEEMNVEDAIDSLTNANNFDYYPKNHGDLCLVEENENQPPVISDLSANPPSVNVNQTTTITCIASDPDGDSLTYDWTKNAGSFEGSTSGSSVTWRSPSTTDIYTVVSCEVSDGNGGEDSESINILVTEPDEDELKFWDGEFSTYQWERKDGLHAPGPNDYSNSIDNVWKDNQGYLHLRITKKDNKWCCAEVYTKKEGWGYGKYEFELGPVKMRKKDANGNISEVDYLDKKVVFGLFTYDSSNFAHKSHNEVDIEFAQWNDKNIYNGNYTVWYASDQTQEVDKNNTFSFPINIGEETFHSFEWNYDKIVFSSNGSEKNYPSNDFIYQENYSPIYWGDGKDYIPISNEDSKEKVHINLYWFQGPPTEEIDIEEIEVIIKSFQFTARENHPPDITSSPVTSATKDEPYGYTVSATDSDGDTLVYSLTTKPSGMTINSSTGLITWTPSALGNYNVTAKASDGELFDTQSFTITVSESNHAPVITSTAVTSATKGQPYSYDVNATDSDGDTRTYSLITKPVGMTINSSTGMINWTPTATGDFNVTVKVSDNGSPVLSDTQSFTIVVSDSQPDSGNKVFLQSGGTLNGTSINPSNPVLTVNSGGSITGTLKVQAIYSGPSGNVVPFGYTPSWGSHSSSYVTVNSDLPVGTTPYNVSINLNAPLTSGTYFLIFATSCEMNLGWTMSRTNWTTGSMSWNDGKDIADLTESNLDDSLSTGYLSLDMLEGSSYKTSTYGITYVKIVVSGEVVNTAPFIIPIPDQTTILGEDFTYAVVATDAEGDTLSYSLTCCPILMVISATGVITWTPEFATQLGLYAITVEVSDGALVDTEEFILTVTVEDNGTYALRDIGPAGGYIFYDKGSYSNGWRYLEAAPASTEWTNKQWGSYGTEIGTERGIGTGQSNTTKIVTWLNSHSETNRAAQLCDALVCGGYSDWFLPSFDEIDLMYTNLKVFGVGGFVSVWQSYGYWSSSEINGYFTWVKYFDIDGTDGVLENVSNSVRAVRAF